MDELQRKVEEARREYEETLARCQAIVAEISGLGRNIGVPAAWRRPAPPIFVARRMGSGRPRFGAVS